MSEDNDISLGNSSKNLDGVRPVDCTGEVQDTVLYGDAGEPIEDFELQDDLGGVSMAGMPREGLSVGRVEDGLDTNVNEDDFAANTPPTPGEPNGAAGTGGGSESPGGCGCGKSGPGGGDAPAVVRPPWWRAWSQALPSSWPCDGEKMGLWKTCELGGSLVD